MAEFFPQATGPLDPNPFRLSASRALDWKAWYALPFQPRFWDQGFLVTSRHETPLFRPVECSLATIAFIPEGDLPPLFSWLFAEDGVSTQDRWLSRSYLNNRFRMVHGLSVEVFVNEAEGFLDHIPTGWVLGKANPTVMPILGGLRLRAPIQTSQYPVARIVPPPARRSGCNLLAVASDMRSLNGFLGTKFGSLSSALYRTWLRLAGRDPSKAAPQIGSSLQIWIADDGCKCFAFAHNYFPKYDYFVDGIRVHWDSVKDFLSFDGFDIDVQWQPFVAFLLYDALRSYPLRERYPGGCAFGWYKSLNDDGSFEWCDRESPLRLVEFPNRFSLDDEYVISWWNRLEEYVRTFTELSHRRTAQHDRPEPSVRSAWWSDVSSLRHAWTSLDLRRWTVRRPTTEQHKA